MNRSAFIIPLVASLFFLIGFFIVGATQKKPEWPTILIAIDGKPVQDAVDTLKVFSTQTLYFRLNEKKKSAETNWLIDNALQNKDSSFTREFIQTGQFTLNIRNKHFQNRDIPIQVLPPFEANIALLSSDRSGKFLVNKSNLFKDETADVKERQWFIDGKKTNFTGREMEHQFSNPGTYKIGIRSLLADNSIAFKEEVIQVEAPPAPARSGAPSGGGGAVPARKAFSTQFVGGFYSSKIFREISESVEIPEVKYTIIADKDFELHSVTMIGTSVSGKISVRLEEENTGIVLATKQIDCRNQQLNIIFDRPLIKKGKSYVIYAQLTDGASIGIYDYNKASYGNFNSTEDYFKPKSSIAKSWLFDWVIYTL